MNKQELFSYITNAFNDSWKITNKHWKNIIKHSIWVYELLKELECKDEICIAWLLHDILEDTNISRDEIKESFWDNVLKLVIANTINKDLDTKLSEVSMINNCISIWYDALIIKTCDIYDSYRFYIYTNNIAEIERTKLFKNMIIEKVSNNDLILLDKILKKII